MKHITRLIGIMFGGFSLAGMMVITGCSSAPRYQTTYNLIQPHSIQGRQCTTQCQTNKLLCKKNEQDAADRCEERFREKVRQCKKRVNKEYHNCMQETTGYSGAALSNMESSCDNERTTNLEMECDNIHDYGCEPAGQCGGKYRACFANCGGVVQKKVVCVENCDKQSKTN